MNRKLKYVEPNLVRLALCIFDMSVKGHISKGVYDAMMAMHNTAFMRCSLEQRNQMTIDVMFNE